MEQKDIKELLRIVQKNLREHRTTSEERWLAQCVVDYADSGEWNYKGKLDVEKRREREIKENRGLILKEIEDVYIITDDKIKFNMDLIREQAERIKNQK